MTRRQLFSSLAFAAAAPAAERAPLNIGSDLQLFVDDYLIDSMTGAELRLHRPSPAGAALAFDQPWEGNVSAYVTVFEDGDRYRMYYRGASSPDYVERSALKPSDPSIPAHPQTSCYAESSDGVRWTRPNLGIHAFNGSKNNNIVWMSEPVTHNFAPFNDGNPDAPASERYKAVGGDRKGLLALKSADGVRWQLMRPEPILTDGAFDSLNVVFWDGLRGHYVAVYRAFRQARAIKVATSKNFLDWTAGQWIDCGDTPVEHFYTNAAQPYFRAPHLYLAFPKRYVPNRKVFDHIRDAGISEAVFMSSRDGLHWDRRFMEAFVRPGRDPRDWVHRNRMPATGLLPTAPAEISMFVSRHYTYPTAHLERMTLRTDGFVSVNAGYRGGEMVTKPFVFAGSKLVFNFETSAAGSIRYEVQDARGNALPGFSLEENRMLYGDEIEHVVDLKAGARSFRAEPIRLRFALKDADLYSFQVRA